MTAGASHSFHFHTWGDMTVDITQAGKLGEIYHSQGIEVSEIEVRCNAPAILCKPLHPARLCTPLHAPARPCTPLHAAMHALPCTRPACALQVLASGEAQYDVTFDIGDNGDDLLQHVGRSLTVHEGPDKSTPTVAAAACGLANPLSTLETTSKSSSSKSGLSAPSHAMPPPLPLPTYSCLIKSLALLASGCALWGGMPSPAPSPSFSPYLNLPPRRAQNSQLSHPSYFRSDGRGSAHGDIGAHVHCVPRHRWPLLLPQADPPLWQARRSPWKKRRNASLLVATCRLAETWQGLWQPPGGASSAGGAC